MPISIGKNSLGQQVLRLRSSAASPHFAQDDNRFEIAAMSKDLLFCGVEGFFFAANKAGPSTAAGKRSPPPVGMTTKLLVRFVGCASSLRSG